MADLHFSLGRRCPPLVRARAGELAPWPRLLASRLGYEDTTLALTLRLPGSDSGRSSSLAAPSAAPSPKARVVGWPPVRSYRKNALADSSKANRAANFVKGFYAWANAEDTEAALPPSSPLPRTLSSLIHHTLAGDVVHAAFDLVCHTAVPLRGSGGHHDAKQLVPDTTFSAFFHKSVVALASTKNIVGLHSILHRQLGHLRPRAPPRSRLGQLRGERAGVVGGNRGTCYGVHRSVGTHVSKVLSVTLDQWTDDEINSIIEVGGNSYANAIYEALLPEDYEKPHPNSSQEERAEFIRSKYELQEFVKPSLVSSYKGSLGETSSQKHTGNSVFLSASFSGEAGMLESIGILKVKVIRGTKLAVRDLMSSNPYVVLNLGQQKAKTFSLSCQFPSSAGL
ncbi:Putative calcium-dependent lipid-binding (CaLB domain) family protein [Zea mays]|uniref:Auxin-responsive protein n=1 Tax=Zea mays TaxID=4577 RepID=A0A1D6NRL0_MAIZE|nr:Putative calcium-dependent lipid-binding (CaLB domain) family protein [Zea mays]